MADQVITEEDWNAALQEGAEQPPEVIEETPPATPEASAEQREAPSEGAEEQPDPYANLSPEVRAKLQRFDEIAATQAALVNELKEARGRIGALQSQWDKARQQATAAPSQTQVAAAAKDPEKWESLKKDFPEWGDAISEFVETRLGSLTGAAKGPSQEEIEQLVAQRTEATTAEIEKRFNETLVTVRHPTWKNDVKTDEFGKWFAGQPSELRALANSKDGADAIRVLDLFYADKAKPATVVKDERKHRQAAAAGAHRPAASGVTAKRVEDMSPQELWNYEARRRTQAAA